MNGAARALIGLALLAWVSAARADDRAGPPVAIVHARVFAPGGRPAVDDATVVLAAGKIQAVGAGMAPPAGAAVVDARGGVLTPGFIDAATDVGVVEVEFEPRANDAAARGAFSPAVRMVDGYNPRSALVPVARSGGVTSVVVVPRVGLLAGQSALFDLAGETVQAAVVRASLAQWAHVDEAAGGDGPGTRGATWLALREALDDARFYASHRADYDANRTRPLALRRAALEALLPVVGGRQPLVVQAHRASDIEAALALGDELGIRLILAGASEAWMVAGDIARRGVPVIVDPLEDLPEQFDRLHARADNAALLSRAGVRVVIATFSAHGVRALWQHAGNAVRWGMDHDAAVRAVTEAPADAFGLRGYGRIEPAAVGNVVVWSGDPLQASTRVRHVFVRGREQPLETRQTLLLERYRSLPARRDGSR